jgi:hypothetical protein
MFLRNAGIFLQAYTAWKPERTLSTWPLSLRQNLMKRGVITGHRTLCTKWMVVMIVTCEWVVYQELLELGSMCCWHSSMSVKSLFRTLVFGLFSYFCLFMKRFFTKLPCSSCFWYTLYMFFLNLIALRIPQSVYKSSVSVFCIRLLISIFYFLSCTSF